MEKHFDRSQILIEQHRYDLAEKELRQEIAENPHFDRAYAMLAFCLINQQKLGEETLQLINYALSLDVENDWHHYILSLYFYNKDNFDLALAAIETSIKLEANSAFYFYVLAAILFDRGQAKFEFDAKRSRVFLLIWTSYFIKPYLKPVFAPLEKSLSLNPQYLPAINLQTNLLGATGRIKCALQSSRIALNIDPNNAIAHRFHGQLLTECGRYSEAIEYFQSALGIEPTFKQAKHGLLEAMRSQYWIYPWISITNWRGKLVFVLTFPIGLIAISAIRNLFDISASVRNHLQLLVYAIITTIIVLSFPSQLIFNLFLQLKAKNNLLITIQDSIIVNYTAGLTIALLLSIYTTMIFDNNSTQYTEMTIVGVVNGIIVVIMTFLPVNSQSKSQIASIGYQLSVGILGIISIAIYIKFNDLERICPLFGFLVLGSPLIATCLSPGWTYDLHVIPSVQNPNNEIDPVQPVQNRILAGIFNIGNYLENLIATIIDRLSTSKSIDARFISKWLVLIVTGLGFFMLMIGCGTLFVMICRSLYQK
jgi:tetratricopeptide (TPR) repeat protein